MIAAVIARLENQVPELAGRVEGAAELNALVQSNGLPQHTPAAHVLPLGLRGGRPDAAAGMFRQEFEETVAVVLTLRNQGRTGDRGLAGADALISAIVAAIAGWAPGDEIGVFSLSRGQLVSFQAGALVYQLDFSIVDQLRISA